MILWLLNWIKAWGGVDFLKLDIHSAEFEALQGAERTLDRVSCVLVETWHWDIHHGAHLHAEVENLLNLKGFRLYDIRPASRWRVISTNSLQDRGMLVGSESVFFRNAPVIGKELALVSLLDLFQYEAEAIRVANMYLPANLAKGIHEFIERENRPTVAQIFLKYLRGTKRALLRS